jgi:PST family polysaccharide transporter
MIARRARGDQAHRGDTVIASMAWSSLGVVFTFGARLLVLAVLARLLSPSDFGLVGAALMVTGFSMAFSQLGMGPALVQREELEPRHVSTAFAASVLLGLAVTALVACVAGPLAAFLEMPRLEPVLLAMCLLFPLQGLTLTGESLLQREMQFRRLAQVRSLSYVLGYALPGIAVASAGGGVWALVAANLGQAAVLCALVGWLKPLPRPRLDRRSMRDLGRFGLGVSLTEVSFFFSQQGDNLVVAKLLGPAALGVYGRAYQLMYLPTQLFSQALGPVVFPVLSRSQRQPAELGQGLLRMLATTALIAIPLSAVAIAAAPEVIAVLLGPGWEAAVPAYQLLSVATFLRLGHKVTNLVNRAAGRVYELASFQTLYGVLVVGLGVVGSRAGIEGVAATTALAVSFHFALLLALSVRTTQVRWSAVANAILPGVCWGVVTWVLAAAMLSGLREVSSLPLLRLAATAAGLAALAAAGIVGLPRQVWGALGEETIGRIVRGAWARRSGNALAG